jgi:signal peptidase II
MQATRGAAVAVPPEAPAPRRTVLLLLTALVVLVVDVVTKVVIVATLEHESHPPVHVLGDVLQIVYTRNSGAAFSVGGGATILFSAVAIAVVIVIARQARRLVSRPWAVTLGLLLGGALGNLVDRLLRDPAPFRGHVVDWIALPHWPVFNVADSAIVLGGCLAVLLASRGVPLEGMADDDGTTEDGTPGDRPVSGGPVT